MYNLINCQWIRAIGDTTLKKTHHVEWPHTRAVWNDCKKLVHFQFGKYMRQDLVEWLSRRIQNLNTSVITKNL